MDDEGSPSLVDRLDDLRHDLGKYLRLPLAFLPPGAPEPEVRQAVSDGLFATRRQGQQVRTARAMWEAFWGDLPGSIRSSGALRALGESVERALAWEKRLDDPEPIDRALAWRDLNGVGDAIGRCLETVAREELG